MENGYIRCFSAPDNLRDWLRNLANVWGGNQPSAAAISDLLMTSTAETARGKRAHAAAAQCWRRSQALLRCR